ncbi:uncharacterized protein Scgbeta isoform X2 [Chelonus insularis]|uniref:uncharacterized protein Scgbeta isoform X2 n=1 Tax=Chelonus insularis TaxID=460826 RepID=UPI00158E4029|nr:uncharacterized protein LOC118066144 isoform X2 [Chelonus insularis]
MLILGKLRSSYNNSGVKSFVENQIILFLSFLKKLAEYSNLNIEIISVLKPSRSPSRSTNDQSTISFDYDKKRYCFWALTIILAAFGLSNLLLSITIISVLRLSRGMESLEIIPDDSLIKFYGSTDLDHICVENGICQGYGDEPAEWTGDDSGIHLTVKNRRHDHLHSNFLLFPNGTSVSSVESFDVKDPKSGDIIFSTNFPNFGLPSGVGHINIQQAITHRIVSPMNRSLNIESRKQVDLRGAESLKMDSKEIVWVANNDIRVKSNQSIILQGKGIFLDMKKIPIVPGIFPGVSGKSNQNLQFKICVCMPEGKLFRIQVPSGKIRVNCAELSTYSQNPCA